MRFAFFYHSLYSDWNHGNAHFLRGIVAELQQRGHVAQVYEPRDGWSLQNLLASHGEQPIAEFRRVYPTLRSTLYDTGSLDLDAELDGVDVVLVHEWNDPALISRIGRHHASSGNYALLFHDTHHRSVTAPQEMERYDLEEYDGALVFGDVIGEIYLQNRWANQVWTWHEAADTRTFYPLESAVHSPDTHQTSAGSRAWSAAVPPPQARDLIWIGNWGDGERTQELMQYLIEPARRLRLNSLVHGVRYPDEGRRALASAGIEYGGWLPNYRVPGAFAGSRVTMHIPRRPYREELHGVPTIRVFEALACGIPLVCLNWKDSEGLFTPGEDYIVVDTPQQMTDALYTVLTEPELSERMVRRGLATIREQHTCSHRVNELLRIVEELPGPRGSASAEARRGRCAAPAADRLPKGVL